MRFPPGVMQTAPCSTHFAGPEVSPSSPAAFAAPAALVYACSTSSREDDIEDDKRRYCVGFLQHKSPQAADPDAAPDGADGAPAAETVDDTPETHGFPADPYHFVATRWKKLSVFFQESNDKLGFLQYKFRQHFEFEREVDWLNYALRLIDKYKPERHTFIPKDEFAPPRPPPRVSVGGNLIFHEGPLWKTKKRSLEALLNTVYR